MASGQKKRVYRKNKTKGSRPGKKWPEEVRTAAMCDLLVSNNICEVARKYGVPESTLRTWMTAAKKKSPAEKRDLFAEERQRQLRALGHMAAAGARNTVQYIVGRLDENHREAAIYYGLKARLDEDDRLMVLEQTGEDVGTVEVLDDTGTALVVLDANGNPTGQRARLTEEARGRLMQQMDRHRPMSDFAATNYLRTLTSVAAKAAEMTGDNESDDRTLVLVVEDI